MEITYSKVGDYYIPNLILENTIKNTSIGKYGRLRLKYLKQYKKAEYTILFMDNKLQEHLEQIDKEAQKRYDIIIKQLVEKENITEELKQKNQLKWVGLMNNFKNLAEEIILKELIYVQGKWYGKNVRKRIF